MYRWEAKASPSVCSWQALLRYNIAKQKHMIHGGRISGLEACGCWHPTGCQCGADECGESDSDDDWGDDGDWDDDDDDGWNMDI